MGCTAVRKATKNYTKYFFSHIFGIFVVKRNGDVNSKNIPKQYFFVFSKTFALQLSSSLSNKKLYRQIKVHRELHSSTWELQSPSLEKKLRLGAFKSPSKKSSIFRQSLGGGFNPIEKYWSKWVHLPQMVMKI